MIGMKENGDSLDLLNSLDPFDPFDSIAIEDSERSILAKIRADGVKPERYRLYEESELRPNNSEDYF